jgi:hypothetical protein
MSEGFAVRCRCDALSGRLAGALDRGTRRLVCYCRDCQAFARFLGGAEDLLDAHGGTDILQLSPARLRIEAGAERLACVRLSPRGLMRWYAACCATPLGNTLATRQLSFVGLVTVVLDGAARARLPTTRRGVFARDALGDGKPPGAADGAPLSMAVPITAELLARRLRGDHRRSPFFDEDGRPVVMPRILNPAARAALDASAG